LIESPLAHLYSMTKSYECRMSSTK
jgi:hypothetical protein